MTMLIRFCTEGEEANPHLRSGIPIVKHQLLLLDAKVHTLVFHVLAAPFEECQGPGAMYRLCDLEHRANADLLDACALAYRLLQHMVCGSSSFAMRLLEYVPFMVSQLDHCWHAADTLSQMFNNNRRLLREIPDRLVACFVRLCIEKHWHGGYIKFLCKLCVCDGQVSE